MTVQLTSAGNLRARTRKSSPTGEKHSTTCRFLRTCEMKNSQQRLAVLRTTPAALPFDDRVPTMPSFSSLRVEVGDVAEREQVVEVDEEALVR